GEGVAAVGDDLLEHDQAVLHRLDLVGEALVLALEGLDLARAFFAPGPLAAAMRMRIGQAMLRADRGLCDSSEGPHGNDRKDKFRPTEVHSNLPSCATVRAGLPTRPRPGAG